MDTPRQETSPNRHSHSHHHDRHERQGQVVSPTRLTQRAASTNQAPSTSPLPTQGTYSLLSHLREQAPTSHPTPAPYTQNLTSSYFLKKQLHSCRIYVLRPTQLERTPRTAKHTAHSTAGDHDRNYTDSTLDARPTPHTTRGSGRCPAALHATTSLALIFSCHVSCRAVRPTERACSTQEPANTPTRSETLQSSYSSSYPPRPPARLLGDVQPQLLLAVLEVRTLGRTHGRPDASAARA